jgi:hypothetical protein
MKKKMALKEKKEKKLEFILILEVLEKESIKKEEDNPYLYYWKTITTEQKKKS